MSSCFVCATPATKQCGRCHSIRYCSVEHQRQHWPEHKAQCKSIEIRNKLLDKITANGLLVQYALSKNLHSQLEKCPKDLIPVPLTPDRVNMWLTVFAFPEEEQYFDQLIHLPTVKILRREERLHSLNPHDCSHFVFGEESWYQTGNLSLLKTLFALYRSALDFLQTKGYIQTDTPQVGSIVVYATNVYGFPPTSHDQFKASHYGKIVRICEDGSIIVHSKFGHGHVYEHRLDMNLFFLGNTYTFLEKSTPTAE